MICFFGIVTFKAPLNRKITRRWIGVGGTTLILTLILGTDYVNSVPINWGGLGQCRDQLVSALASREVQNVELLCFSVYLVAFLLRGRSLRTSLEAKAKGPGSDWYGEVLRCACLFLFCCVALAQYFLGPSRVSGSTDAVVLFLGMLVGQMVLLAKIAQRNSGHGVEIQEDVVNSLILLLALSVLYQPHWWHRLQYRGQTRWQGIWWNPNNFGLLMATGLVLVVGRFLQTTLQPPPDQRESHIVPRNRIRAACSVAGALLMVGLLKSYSRGSWLAAGVGLVYLGSQFAKAMGPGWRAWLSKSADETASAEPALLRSWICQMLANRRTLLVITVSTVMLAFLGFRNTEIAPARRVFSVGSPNDFSWRNRVAAYEGALQMMAARPWSGFGWDQPAEVFNEWYKPVRLVEPFAIYLNDYFMVGMTLGLPALASLLLYIGSRYRAGANPACAGDSGVASSFLRREASGWLAAEWLDATCRAGATVLAVGFWFERGLFWVALTVPFWILLELGGSNHRKT